MVANGWQASKPLFCDMMCCLPAYLAGLLFGRRPSLAFFISRRLICTRTRLFFSDTALRLHFTVDYDVFGIDLDWSGGSVCIYFEHGDNVGDDVDGEWERHKSKIQLNLWAEWTSLLGCCCCCCRYHSFHSICVVFVGVDARRRRCLLFYLCLRNTMYSFCSDARIIEELQRSISFAVDRVREQCSPCSRRRPWTTDDKRRSK